MPCRLGRGERLVVIGVSRDVIRALISDETERSALLVASEGQVGAEALIERLLDDLAALALESWPHWNGRDAFLNPAMADPC